MTHPVAFLFDLDGVLIDSEKQYTLIWEEIERHYPTGVAGFSQKIKGTNLDNILSTYFPAPEVRGEVEKMLYRLEGEMVYSFMPGIREMLVRLRESGYKLALYTSSNERKMDHLYRDIPGFAGYFDAIVTGDMVTASKPDPEGYLLAAKLVEAAPERTVVVEDSLQGVRAGKNAGAFVVGIEGTIPSARLAEFSDIVLPTAALLPDGIN